MTIRAVMWAHQLRDVGPATKLVAMFIADCTRDDCETNPIPQSAICDWAGITGDEVKDVLAELTAIGVEVFRVQGKGYRFALPLPPISKALAPLDHPLSIYVIAAYAATKVGISRHPPSRMAGLQAANPMETLRLLFTEQGPSSVIRRVEKTTHGRLAGSKLSNEWFEVDPEDAIAAVKSSLRDVGLSE